MDVFGRLPDTIDSNDFNKGCCPAAGLAILIEGAAPEIKSGRERAAVGKLRTFIWKV
jgi:hypothetical protein